MGAGASSQGMDLIATTMMIGQAIASITFPGMFRIYDFHSPLAPRLKVRPTFSFSYYGADSDDEQDDYVPPEPSQYEFMFHITVGDDVIYLEDPLYENDSGWTALHACCMSFSTVPAGIVLIDKIVSLGGSLDVKTMAGPGSYNRQWTPLQMASAYGIVPLVEKLVQEGADVNCTNSFGYSPLLEACHRGFNGVVTALLRKSPDLSYIPSDEQASSSPFVGAPPQAAMAEAARSGFFKIVQDLIDAGAKKDFQNAYGWTALHEACFYNRIETAKVLLLSGASASLRTTLGALPYHLTELKYLRTMLEEMGGPSAKPAPGDEVDMVSILKELTAGEPNTIVTDADGNMHIISGLNFHSDCEDEYDDEDGDEEEDSDIYYASQGSRLIEGKPSSSSPTSAVASTGNSGGDSKTTPPGKEAKKVKRKDQGGEKLLHSGSILGDLPAISMTGQSPEKRLTSSNSEIDAALSGDGIASQNFMMTPSGKKSPSMKADDKTAGTLLDKKKKKKKKEGAPKDMPPKYVCQLTNQPMSEPVKTIYGNHFDSAAIVNWFQQQGRICPLTGMPLCETDLTPLPELGNEIREWIFKRSLEPPPSTSASSSSSNPNQASVNNSCSSSVSAAAVGDKKSSSAATDDLYDF